jgi:hypothetical protein
MKIESTLIFQILISCFRKEEVKCWVDMSDSGCVPALYLFKLEKNKVSLHMEILKNGDLTEMLTFYLILLKCLFLISVYS